MDYRTWIVSRHDRRERWIQASYDDRSAAREHLRQLANEPGVELYSREELERTAWGRKLLRRGRVSWRDIEAER